MRKLMMSDVYKMSRIMKKLNLKPESKDKDQQEMGVELILKVTENIHLAEAEVNDFLGGLVGITGEAFGKLEFLEAAKHLKDFKNLDGVKDFLKLAGESMK